MIAYAPLSLTRERLGATLRNVARVAIPIAILSLITGFLPGYDLSQAVASGSGLVAALALVGAAIALKSWSMIWTIALPCFGVSAIASGASVVGVRLLLNAHAPFGTIGWTGLILVVTGATSVALYRYWANRRDRTHDVT
jgi:hypothetical protein